MKGNMKGNKKGNKEEKRDKKSDEPDRPEEGLKQIRASQGFGAYFTLEAALVMPVVLGVMLFAVSMLLFQYNRCTLDQRLGIAVLRGCMEGSANADEAIACIKKEFASVKAPDYVMAEAEGITVRAGSGRVEAIGEMEMKAVYISGLSEKYREWRACERMLGIRQNPAATVRFLQRILDKKTESKEE